MHGDTAEAIIDAITDIEDRILALCGYSLPDMFRKPDQSGEDAMFEQMISPLGDVSYNLAVLVDEGEIK